MFGLFAKKQEVPAWAAFFTPEEYAHFESELKQYFDARGYTYTLDDGIIRVAAGGDLQGELGLVNLGNRGNNQITLSRKSRKALFGKWSKNTPKKTITFCLLLMCSTHFSTHSPS